MDRVKRIWSYLLCEQRRFRRACASAQSRQNLCCSLIQAVNQEELSDRKPDPWPLWMAGHAQLKFVMTECSKTQIRLTGLMLRIWFSLKKKQNLGGSTICKDAAYALMARAFFRMKFRRILWKLFYKQEINEILKRNNNGYRQEEILIMI